MALHVGGNLDAYFRGLHSTAVCLREKERFAIENGLRDDGLIHLQKIIVICA